LMCVKRTACCFGRSTRMILNVCIAVNEDGASVSTTVAVKLLRYMPITPRLKRLYLSEETVK
jgi:hypothetical protein